MSAKRRPKAPTGTGRHKPEGKNNLRQWRREVKNYRLWRKENVEEYQ